MGPSQFTAPGKKKKEANAGASTQTHLRIAEIRDNTLILKNGGTRAILKVTSLNFNLKSEQEQNAIIYAYQSFLNSLEFPIQILVRSKKLNLDNYIEQMETLGEKQENKLLQEQTIEYAQYIRRLIDYANIMEKNFYVIIPYDPLRAKSKNIVQAFFERLSPKDSYGDIKKRHAEFKNLKKGLTQRIHTVKAGLENCGLKAEPLDTQEIIELYYNSYNPQVSRSAKLKNLKGITIETDEEKLEKEEKSSM